MKIQKFTSVIIGIVLLSTNEIANAGWLDWLTGKTEEVKEAVSTGDTTKVVEAALSNEQIAEGLKQALTKGADVAVNSLGKAGGFLNNNDVRIPMPEKLSKIESILRQAGQDKYADEFVKTMNSAAEQAVPLTLDIIKDGIKNMTVSDAKAILDGNDDAATQYLRRVESTRLKQKIAPVVSQATAKAGVTKAYKFMYDKMGFAGNLLNLEDYDIDSYVTEKTMNGLFTLIAQEEKKIRDNPVERTTDILKQVFGSR